MIYFAKLNTAVQNSQGKLCRPAVSQLCEPHHCLSPAANGAEGVLTFIFILSYFQPRPRSVGQTLSRLGLWRTPEKSCWPRASCSSAPASRRGFVPVLGFGPPSECRASVETRAWCGQSPPRLRGLSFLSGRWCLSSSSFTRCGFMRFCFDIRFLDHVGLKKGDDRSSVQD